MVNVQEKYSHSYITLWSFKIYAIACLLVYSCRMVSPHTANSICSWSRLMARLLTYCHFYNIYNRFLPSMRAQQLQLSLCMCLSDNSDCIYTASPQSLLMLLNAKNY